MCFLILNFLMNIIILMILNYFLFTKFNKGIYNVNDFILCIYINFFITKFINLFILTL